MNDLFDKAVSVAKKLNRGCKYLLQHLTGVQTPLLKIRVGLKMRLNRYINFYEDCSRGVRGVQYNVWMKWSLWSVRNVAIHSQETSNVGVRYDVADLDLKANGVSAPVNLVMLTPANIGGLKMGAIALRGIQQNYAIQRASNAEAKTTYSSLTLNLFGLAESISG